MPEHDIQSDYNEAYDIAWAATSGWQAEARRDIQAYLGDIFTQEEKIKLKLRGSDLLSIQLIRPILNWFSGYQIDHRKGIKYQPSGEKSDIDVANDLTAIGMSVLERNGGYDIISDAFHHALKTGLCLVNTFNDINSNTKLDHFFYNQFLLDPTWTKLDLSDCNFLMMRKFVTSDQAKILLPEGFHSEISRVGKLTEDAQPANTDGKFPNYLTPVQFGQNMFSYDEFQQRETKKTTFILIKTTGAEIEWTGTEKQLEEELPVILETNNIPAEMVSTITKFVPTIKVSAFLNGEHVATEMDPFGLGDYSATPIKCFYDPEYDQMEWKLQGLVRSLKDVQRAETKRIISSVAWFENSAANGLDFEEDTLVDPEDAFKTGIGPRMFKKNALVTNAVRDRVTPPIPGGMLELHNLLTDLMPRTVNLNPDMMGLSPDATREQISGILGKLRIGTGLVGSRGLFNSLSRSQNIIGRKLLKLYQQYPMEKVKRILGREPAQGFKEQRVAEFDALSAESILSDTQRDMQYQEIITLIKLGQEVGKPFPATWKDILELGTLQISSELLKKIEQREQEESKRNAEAAKVQQRTNEVALESLMSQAREDDAQAQERKTESIVNMAQAGLDRAKTATEIQGLKTDDTLKRVDQLIDLGKLQLEQQKLNQPLQKGGK